MYAEADLLALSGLQHLVYCPRQWGLIHLEQQWAENRWTAEGRVLHERADTEEVEVRPGMRIVRGLWVQSRALGLAGRADVVEFHGVGEGRRSAGILPAPGEQVGSESSAGILPISGAGSGESSAGASPAISGVVTSGDSAGETPALPLGEDGGWHDLSQLNRLELAASVALRGVRGRWRVVPVEYKRGKPKKGLEDKVQLCAQALCLEEMLRTAVPEGALYYGKTRRRLAVPFDAALRAETARLAAEMHRLYEAGVTPGPVNDARCKQCSLIEQCLPAAMDRARRGRGWLEGHLRGHLEESDE